MILKHKTVATSANEVLITLIDSGEFRRIQCSIDQYDEWIQAYMEGASIDQAFSVLTPLEREFLTGGTGSFTKKDFAQLKQTIAELQEKIVALENQSRDDHQQMQALDNALNRAQVLILEQERLVRHHLSFQHTPALSSPLQQRLQRLRWSSTCFEFMAITPDRYLYCCTTGGATGETIYSRILLDEAASFEDFMNNWPQVATSGRDWAYLCTACLKGWTDSVDNLCADCAEVASV